MQKREIDNLVAREPVVPIAWYAAYTKHQHEKGASEALARKGFDVLLPLYRAMRRWKDRTKMVLLPVFPCYVFLQTTLDRKLEVLRTPGVFWLVENGGRACPIPESEIEAIRQISRSGTPLEPHPYLNCGEHVRVHSGPLTGVKGILSRVKNRCRVVISVELLHKAVAVEVDAAIVEPLPLFRPGGSAAMVEKRVGA